MNKKDSTLVYQTELNGLTHIVSVYEYPYLETNKIKTLC